MAPVLVANKKAFLRTDEGKHKVIAAHHAALSDEPLGHPFKPTYRPPLPPNSIIFRASGTTEHDKTPIQLIYPEVTEIQHVPTLKQWRIMESNPLNAAFLAKGWTVDKLKEICDSINQKVQTKASQSRYESQTMLLEEPKRGYLMKQYLFNGIGALVLWIIAMLCRCLMIKEDTDYRWEVVMNVLILILLLINIFCWGVYAQIVCYQMDQQDQNKDHGELRVNQQVDMVREYIRDEINPKCAEMEIGGITLSVVEEDVVQYILTDERTGHDLTELIITTEMVIAVSLLEEVEDDMVQVRVSIDEDQEQRKGVDLEKFGMVMPRLSMIK